MRETLFDLHIHGGDLPLYGGRPGTKYRVGSLSKEGAKWAMRRFRKNELLTPDGAEYWVYVDADMIKGIINDAKERELRIFHTGHSVCCGRILMDIACDNEHCVCHGEIPLAKEQRIKVNYIP